MAKVILKKVCDSSKYGRRLKTITIEILGNPPHVLAFKEVTKKSEKQKGARGALIINYLSPFLLDPKRHMKGVTYTLLLVRGLVEMSFLLFKKGKLI